MKQTIVEIGMLLDNEIEYYQKLLEKQGAETVFCVETHDLYYTNNTRAELEKMTEKQIKDSCVRLRECWAFGGSEFSGDLEEKYSASNYKLFDEKKKDSFKFKNSELKKYIKTLEDAGWLLFFDTFKRDYQYKLGDMKSRIQLQEIDNIGLVLYYDNPDYYNMPEDVQRKSLIDELNSYGFDFDYAEPGIDKLKTLLKGTPHFSNNQNA